MPPASLQQLQDFVESAYATTWDSRDAILDEMEALYEQSDPADKNTIVLAFALAKIHDDLGNTDAGFAYLKAANKCHRQGKTDTIEDARQTVAAVKALFSSQSVAPLHKTNSQHPIFIVGLPRSGTTLVEQILASHRQVFGGGELKLMGQWCFGYLKLYAQYGDNAPLTNYLEQLWSHYVAGLNNLTSQTRITDKMPVNFLWLGFIRAAFPDARIVHTRRDPMATCWSMYKTPFAGTSNGYACDLQDIGEFYCLYADLMEFWEAQHGTVIYNLDYETLTREQEQQTRQLLDYCELDWDPACLEFHNNSRTVHTASAHQVTRPMYQGSSDAWRKYDAHLEPLKNALARQKD